MKVITLAVGQLGTNCYLVIDNQEAVIIDPGAEADFISQKILEEKVKPIAILLTHGHFDHVLGTYELVLNFKIPVYANKNDVFLIKNARKNAEFWTKLDQQIDPPKVNNFLVEDDKVQFGKTDLKVIVTPGHTPGSVCFYNQKEKILFSGDTVFKDGFGRTDFSYSSKPDLIKSVKKLLKLPIKTIVYPGHGEMFKIGSNGK